MVEDQTQEEFRNEIAVQERERRDAVNAMDQFDNRMKGSKLFGGGGDSSSEEEERGARRQITPLELEKTKNQILMDKLYRA